MNPNTNPNPSLNPNPNPNPNCGGPWLWRPWLAMGLWLWRPLAMAAPGYGGPSPSGVTCQKIRSHPHCCHCFDVASS